MFAEPESNNNDQIYQRFDELFEIDEIKKLFNELLPKTSLFRSMIDINSITDKNEILEMLLQLIGDNFLYELPFKQDKEVRIESPENFLRRKLILAASKKYNISERLILSKWNDTHKPSQHVDVDKKINEMHRIFQDTKEFVAKDWAIYVTQQLLNLPDKTIVKPEKISQEPETKTLQKKSKLKTLHDYQYQSVKKIISMLSNKDEKEKAVIINLPTGAGKTRLTIEAIIEWLNLREAGLIKDAHPQQKNGSIIFWFASTNELCEQAASEFEYIFSKIGAGHTVHLTRLFGSRSQLKDILQNYKGTHIVVTNTHHFTILKEHYDRKKKLNEGNPDSSKYLIDVMSGNQELETYAKNTICVIVDEAHEITRIAYRRFLAALGFDISGRKESKDNFSRNNIILIGLTATAYKGSGISELFECNECEMEFKTESDLQQHIVKTLHAQISMGTGDTDDIPNEIKDMNLGTRQIFKSFQNNVYVPLPGKIGNTQSKPTAIIDAPIECMVGEFIKISGTDSFDRSSELEFSWKITSIDEIIEKNESYFTHKFVNEGIYSLSLTVKNKNDPERYDTRTISITVRKSDSNFKGTIKDNEEFYRILTDKKILCPIVHGVIKGNREISVNAAQEKEIKKSGSETKTNQQIMKDVEYNKQVLEIVDKCLNKYNRNKILIFANSVNHAYEISQILRVRYKIRSNAVNGETRPGTRRKIIQDFRDDKIDVLVNFGVLTTGFDVPKIDTVIISRLVLINTLMTQMIGRGQRGVISGGTEDLWLITSNFPKSADSINIKLGWENSAEEWANFPSEIRKDLGVIDFEFSKSKIQKSSVTKNPINIRFKDSEGNERYQCKICSRNVKIDNLKEFFDFTGFDKVENILYLFETPSTSAGDKFNELTAGGKCKSCKKIHRIANKVECEFTKKFAEEHNFDSNLIKIANFVINESKLNIHVVEIINKLNIDMNTIIKLNNSIFDIKDSNLIFKKLSQPDQLKEIIEIIKNDVLYSETDIINNEQLSENKDDVTKLFYDLKNILGHTPTKRQFLKLINSENLKNEFEIKYGKEFKEILHREKISIRNDYALENLLYDEYFEKYHELGRKLTSKEIDEHGVFRLSDYQEFFGSFQNFVSNIEEILVKKSKYTKEFTILDVIKDLNINVKKFQNIFNFKNILSYSKHPEIYINNFSTLTFLKFISNEYEKFKVSQLGIHAKLFFEFIRLINLLNNIPKLNVILKSLDDETRNYFSTNYQNDIDKFMNENGFLINSDSNENINQIMKEGLEKKLEEYYQGDKKEWLKEIIEFLMSDELYINSKFDKQDLEFLILLDNFFENRNFLNNYC